MEDTVLRSTKKSVKKFVDSINFFMPISTDVQGTGKVKNVYYSEEQIKEIGAKTKKFPLFSIDLMLDKHNEVVYSHEPADVVLIILNTFDNGLMGLKEIP